MRLFTPQITWHGGENGRNDPVLSVDAHPFCAVVATGGADGEVRLWRLDEAPGAAAPRPVCLASLALHERGVNCVRFSPGGTFLASASDDGNACLWHIKPHVLASLCKSSAELYDPEVCRAAWTKISDEKDLQRTILRGRGAEIYDISWSPTGEHLAAACISQCVQVWHVTRRAGNICGRVIAQLDKHNHFVQGVVWDPAGAFLASVSADRTLRIFNSRWRAVGGATAAKVQANGDAQLPQKRLALTQAAVVKHRFFKPKAAPRPASDAGANPRDAAGTGEAGPKASPPAKAPKTALFADETLPSFFRRVDWTPDGSALVVPAGVYRRSPDADPEFATHIIGRGRWHDNPMATLLSRDRPSVAVRMCPKVFGFRSASAAAAPASTAVRATEAGSSGGGDVTSDAHVGAKGHIEVDGSGAKSGAESGAANAEGMDVTVDSVSAAAGSTRETLLPPAPDGAWSNLRHRNVFAVLTTDGIFVYDTAHANPIVVAQGLHYANLTDACWSADGRLLLVSSRDGYVTMLRFDEGELGPEVPEEALPEHMRSGRTPRADEAMQASSLVTDTLGAVTPDAREEPSEGIGESPVANAAGDPAVPAAPTPAPAPEPAVQQESVDPVSKKRRIAPMLVSVET